MCHLRRTNRTNCTRWRHPTAAVQSADDQISVPVYEIMDGSNVHIIGASQSNLGVLGSIAERDSIQGTEELWPTQNLQSISGMTFNGTSFVGSIVLLAVLLAITFERVLGLDRMWANFLSDWKSKRRLEKLTDLEVNRSTLESLMSQDDDDEFDRRR